MGDRAWRAWVSFADSSPPVEGKLEFGESNLAPGGFLTLREVAAANDPPRDMVVASEGVRDVKFLD